MKDIINRIRGMIDRGDWFAKFPSIFAVAIWLYLMLAAGHAAFH